MNAQEIVAGLLEEAIVPTAGLPDALIQKLWRLFDQNAPNSQFNVLLRRYNITVMPSEKMRTEAHTQYTTGRIYIARRAFDQRNYPRNKLLSIIHHEQVHAEQLRRSNKKGAIKAWKNYHKKRPPEDAILLHHAAHYHGSTPEITAWARQIALELEQTFGSKTEALNLLRTDMREAAKKNKALWIYYQISKNYPETWKRFLKQLTAYLTA